MGIIYLDTIIPDNYIKIKFNNYESENISFGENNIEYVTALPYSTKKLIGASSAVTSKYVIATGGYYTNTIAAYTHDAVKVTTSITLRAEVNNNTTTYAPNDSVVTAGGATAGTKTMAVDNINNNLVKTAMSNLTNATYNLTSTHTSNHVYIADGTLVDAGTRVINVYNKTLIKSQNITDHNLKPGKAMNFNNHAVFAGDVFQFRTYNDNLIKVFEETSNTVLLGYIESGEYLICPNRDRDCIIYNKNFIKTTHPFRLQPPPEGYNLNKNISVGYKNKYVYAITDTSDFKMTFEVVDADLNHYMVKPNIQRTNQYSMAIANDNIFITGGYSHNSSGGSQSHNNNTLVFKMTHKLFKLPLPYIDTISTIKNSEIKDNVIEVSSSINGYLKFKV